MMETATYLVSEEIAARSGMIDSRYRIADGRYVLNESDLSRVRFTIDEYINGLSGVERVERAVSKTLIAQNNYQLGRPKENPAQTGTEGESATESGNAESTDTDNNSEEEVTTDEQ